MKSESETNQECCPKFDPLLWDEEIVEWNHKTFIRDSVFTLFYMPVNFGGAMKRLNKKVEEAGATIPGYLCLSDHTSRWNMDLYLAVDKHISGTENVTLSGKYYSKVYEGPFQNTGKWCNDFEKSVEARGLYLKHMYMWYTTCPKCAKKYGKNFVVIIAEVE